jgi:hypothetical protein
MKPKIKKEWHQPMIGAKYPIKNTLTTKLGTIADGGTGVKSWRS